MEASNGNSYMEQKKEELRRWKLSQERIRNAEVPPTMTNPPQISSQPPMADPNFSNEEERENRKRQLEARLAEQMAMMNVNAKQGSPQNDYPPLEASQAVPQQISQQPEYGYQNDNPYQAPPIEKSSPNIPAGGKSIRKESEDNKFNLSGYDNNVMGNQDTNSQTPSYYVTSAQQYGNYKKDRLSKLLISCIYFRFSIVSR